MAVGELSEYQRSDSFGPLARGLAIGGAVLVIVGILTDVFLSLEISLNLSGWGMMAMTSGILLFLGFEAQNRSMSDGVVMGLISWGLFAPSTIGFQALTLVSFGGIEKTIPTGGGLQAGPLTFGPWWFYFWMGLSVFLVAWPMTVAKIPRWPPRRFIVWPWVTGFFVAFVWPTRLVTAVLGIEIGDWTLETGWTSLFDRFLSDFLLVSFEFEPISFGEYWGAFFLYLWLLLAFSVWTVFVYGRRLRVGKKSYADGDV